MMYCENWSNLLQLIITANIKHIRHFLKITEDRIQKREENLIYILIYELTLKD